MAGKFELKIAKNGKYHWSLKASNGQIILTSQMYASKETAMNGINSVKTNAVIPERFESKVSEHGKPYFVLKAANGQVIGNSQMYETEKSRDNGIQSVANHAPDAAVEDLAE